MFLTKFCYNAQTLNQIAKEFLMAILDDVKEVIVQQLNVDAAQVKPEAEFVKDLGADSLDVVELVMALEEKFDIEIPDEQAEKISTVGDVVAYIEANKK